MSSDELYSVISKNAPIIRPGRWYIANEPKRVLVIDQPQVGFETEGEARMYLRNQGPHIDQTVLTVVSAELVS